MAKNFYTKWQNAILADAGEYVSKEYRSFQTALVRFHSMPQPLAQRSYPV